MTLERGALLHNRYRIAEILGQGGMGSVYRAVDENLGVDVAVKENLFTTDEYARQFRLEAVILANLRHPNLPRVTDHFVIGDQGQYLVMDYIEGEDLRQRMERTNFLPDDEVILIGAAMSKALTYLHTRKPPILHRDIKPGNVKVTPEGEVFLVDFGLAKVIQGTQVTTTGARAMTPGYSPPEQYGTARTDSRTDVYSLGATLYAALTGVIPEDGLARAMENAELTPIRKRAPKVSRRLAAAIERAMEVDSDDRFQTPEEFRKALLAANSKTQRLVEDDFTVAPAPAETPASIEKVPEGEAAKEESAPVGVPLMAANTAPITSPESPRKKRRKQRWKFIRFLLYMILIVSALGTAAYYYPRISSLLSTATGTSLPIVLPTETELASLPVVEEIPTEIFTATPFPTATNTPEPTATPLPTETPTIVPTPLGGGAGEMAFVSERAGTPQIYIANVDGSNARPITNLSDGACQPDWSPDGQQLVFVSPCKSDVDILKDANLYLINADGTNLTQLTSETEGDFEPAWSPDGKQIAFTSLRPGHLQVYSIYLEDDAIIRLTQSNRDEPARQPAWSPFGNQIAYAIRRYGAYQIWTMTDTGQSPERITVSGYIYWDLLPVWTTDGTAILYTQRAADNGVRFWQMRIAYENRGNVGEDVELGALPVLDADYSNDGLWILFEGTDGNNRDIFVVMADGESRTRLTTDPADDYDPVWRPAP
ncbi:MAG: protein kinase [Anaerolineae bacterium]|jgi:eukaryotic-like serine/threonine-protein kinase|nr:protein kinase [Anaerolineae bacterium]MBT7070982.1 protein kinase [Anaerolineae bacterium]MBT7325888.1 protein kinase [Anaerolineae bacterium]